MFKVYDELECIKDGAWKGIKDYVRVGDRAVIKGVNTKGNAIIFDIEITRGWHSGHIVPVHDQHTGTYFRHVEKKSAEYKVGQRLVAHETFELSYMKCDRGDVAVIKTQVDDLFDIRHEKTGKNFQFYTNDIRRYFDVEAPNPCPPSLRKWLSNVQTQRS